MFSKRRAYLCMRCWLAMMAGARADRPASLQACGASHVVLGYMCCLSSAALDRLRVGLTLQRSRRSSCT